MSLVILGYRAATILFRTRVHESDQIIQRHRSTKEKTLKMATAAIDKEIALLLGLDSFCDYLQSERLTKCENGLNNDARVKIARDVPDE